MWLTTELSNPFVNALWLLRTLGTVAVGVSRGYKGRAPLHPLLFVSNAGYTDTVAYAATGLSLVIVFFAVRIVLVFYYWYIVATDFEVSAATPSHTRAVAQPGVWAVPQHWTFAPRQDLAKVLLPTDVMAIFGTCATGKK